MQLSNHGPRKIYHIAFPPDNRNIGIETQWNNPLLFGHFHSLSHPNEVKGGYIYLKKFIQPDNNI